MITLQFHGPKSHDRTGQTCTFQIRIQKRGMVTATIASSMGCYQGTMIAKVVALDFIVFTH